MQCSIRLYDLPQKVIPHIELVERSIRLYEFVQKVKSQI